MAKVIIKSQRAFSLGPNFTSIQLKVGRNEVEERDFDLVKDKWFIQSLITSGAIVVSSPPPEVVAPPEQLVEVIIRPVALNSVVEPSGTLPEVKQEVSLLTPEDFNPPDNRTMVDFTKPKEDPPAPAVKGPFAKTTQKPVAPVTVKTTETKTGFKKFKK